VTAYLPRLGPRPRYSKRSPLKADSLGAGAKLGDILVSRDSMPRIRGSLQSVYYSLATGHDSYCHGQWVQSIRSLRKYNDRIRVDLMIYNNISSIVVEEARRWGVNVHLLGNYTNYIAMLHNRSQALCTYPTLHKWLSLMHIPDDATQVLYLDCDTFFFSDVAKLFSRHSIKDFYAREEVKSKRSYMPYNSSYLDEEGLATTAAMLGISFVEPFNTGVVMWNRGSWKNVNALRHCYLDYCWRLMVGRHLTNISPLEYELPVRHSVLSLMGEKDWATAIPYPSSNPWLLDEVALWLTLGQTSMQQGYFDPETVTQSREYIRPIDSRVVSHYFGAQEIPFFSIFPPI
jgi:hypothetical protein